MAYTRQLCPSAAGVLCHHADYLGRRSRSAFYWAILSRALSSKPMYVVRVNCILARPILCRTIRLWWCDNIILQMTGQMKLGTDSSPGHCVRVSLPIYCLNCKYELKGSCTNQIKAWECDLVMHSCLLLPCLVRLVTDGGPEQLSACQNCCLAHLLCRHSHQTWVEYACASDSLTN